MSYETVTVICVAVAAIILASCSIAAIVYEKDKKKKKLTEGDDPSDWLFSGAQETFFDMFYKKPSSEKLCGISREEYARYCKILHRENDFKKTVAMRLEAAIAALLLAILAYIVSYSTAASMVCVAAIAAVIYLLWVRPYSSLKNEAEERLYTIENDLPRFLSLMEKAMDLPVDQAMLVTASRFQSPLSDDIVDSITKVSLGADGWEDTLVGLAKTYQIEDFSDLILEIVNSYEQGVNIRDLVNRKAREVEQTRLYAVEAHDSKIKTMIFLPIIALKIVPLMVLICLPMIQDFM